MLTNALNKWLPRVLTLAVWALAAASAAWWGLRLAGPLQPAVAPPQPAGGVAEVVVDPNAVARVLGATAVAAAVAPALSSRFVLLGVVAGRSGGGGAALIAVDGKPGRPYRVGAKVDEGLVLQSVEPRRARLAPVGGTEALLTLEMPPTRK